MGIYGGLLSQSCHVSLSSVSSLCVPSPSSSSNSSNLAFMNSKALSFSNQPLVCSKNGFFSEKKNSSRFSAREKKSFQLKAEVKTQERETISLGGSTSEDNMSGVLEFAKYHGLGNDFLLVDNRNSSEPKVTPGQAIKLCDRNFGVGADGVIFALPGTESTEYTMRIYNSDGSEPEMCGNGIRCMARFVAELEGAKNEAKIYRVQTLAGPMVLDLREDGQVAVDMGPPTLQASLVPTTLSPNTENGAVVAAPLEIDGTVWKVTCVSMGNPHCITFSNENQENLKVSEIDLTRIGPIFKNNSVFPARTNTEFVEVISPSELKMRVWERGAGPTLACGTGACALVVAGVLEGRAERKCTVHLPGGPLEIEWREEDNHVYMTGPAQLVFHGKAYL